VIHDLDVVAVGVEDERSVVARVVVPLAGRAVVGVAGARELAMERVHGRVVVGLEGEVDGAPSARRPWTTEKSRR
jgi:hypothetical protein